MKQKNILIILSVAILTASCASQKNKDNTVTISGAFALYPLVVKWTDEYKKLHPEIRFDISAGGAGKGMADALSGTVDLGMVSRAIAKEEKDKGAWWVGTAIDAVIPTISSQNPNLVVIKEKGLKKSDFTDIFVSGKIKNWGSLLNTQDKKTIVVYTRSDACGAAETWAKYLGGKQENLKGIGIFGDPGVAEAVAKDPEGIGYNNTAFAFDKKTGKKRSDIEIPPIDINENGKIDPEENFYDSFDSVLKAIAEGIYPSPPARELYLAGKGKPSKKATLEFLKWVLTDGQKFVKEAGYVPIDSDKIKKYLEQLN
jgi:phosphate transport system substrate-binding protein